MNINRNNYEEFFLLYVDNELTPPQRLAVEQFISVNPDLAGELDLFRETAAAPEEEIVFKGKELLMKRETPSFITLENYEEYLVAYVDQELTPAERADVEVFAAGHPTVQEALSVFQLTKLQPEQAVVFANKEILYRKEEKVKVISLQWWKIAVAAAVLLAVGITTITVMNNRSTTVPADVASTDVKKAKPSDTKKSTVAPLTLPAPDTSRNALAVSHAPADSHVTDGVPENKVALKKGAPQPVVKEALLAKKQAPVKTKNQVDQQPLKVTQEPDNSNVAVKQSVPVADNKVAINTAPAKQNNNTAPVTKDLPQPSGNKEIAPDTNTETGAVFASNNEEGKNKKLRGFFRKATRIFEKRTNISAADDDDKVLIGVLAVRLK